MENSNEDVYYADIANLREVLAAPLSSDDDDEKTLDNATNGSDENTNILPQSFIDLDDVLLDERASTPRMCRTFGSACYDVLFIIEKQLLTMLEKCQTKIKDLQDHIDSIKSQNEKSLMTRSSWYYMFGIPYFKDWRYFPCPPNEDYLKKTANMELSIIDLPVLKVWKEREKLNLMAAVRTQEIAKQLKEAEIRKQPFVMTEDGLDGPSEIQVLGNCQPLLETKSLPELVGCSKSEYDWMKISAVDLEGMHSADECRAMWFNYLHPGIRKAKWTKDEDDMLKELVVKYKNQNWDGIAQELGTQRSAYQCMFQYQTRLNDSLRRNKWTKEEDDYLKEVVERCRFGSYIPWGKVTYFMTGRSKTQVFNHWSYSLNPSLKKGRFTKEEDILLVAAVRRHGTDFSRVARFLPGRTSTQIRYRYNSVLAHEGNGEPWTPKEDELLMTLVTELGEGKWSEISQHFKNRSRTQVRHRYTTLQNWQRKVPADMREIPPAPTRRHNIESNREEKIWNKVQAILGNVEMGVEMDEQNLMKLKEKMNLKGRKHRGRKLGQKKVLSVISKRYYSFFRCVYPKTGGRKKLRYEEHFVKTSGQVIYNMLQYFQAHLDIPKDDSAIDGDHLLEETDRFILRYLRDRKEHLNASEIFEQEGNSTDLCNDILPTVDTAAADVLNGAASLRETTLTSQVPNTAAALPEIELAASQAQNLGFSTMLPENCPLRPSRTTSKIPYLCPPNHTTLVGFRTFLLSRRNIALNADDIDRVIKSEVSDTTNSDISSVSCSERITPAEAAALWKERLASLFVWPAIMSNTVPKVKECLFQSDDPPVASTSHGITDGGDIESVSSSNCGVRATKTRICRKISRKKKWRRKKKEKDAALSPPKKKRKYERTGKYKKPPQCVVQKRITRHSSASASGPLESEDIK
ncbi:hypothetical protein B7P43_G15504 [Cryptotermes secundus]|uniref:snRNA-activating protein complex subunit 4 n=1 Tax=Cryptotermes secundus TaxID=105785 RepID=A0A2J7PIP7_9NEOP|nr:uncharacterized protein LOC111873678 [Cryptotermes secundus]PNF16217.1 hypothetical protein B7P43_G15504 [Cryptotermes secundus]